MSWQATSATKRLTCDDSGLRLTRTEKLILMILSDGIDPYTGLAIPSQELLAQQAACTSRTVRRILVKLRARGLVEIEGRGGRGGHQYRLTYVPPEEARKADKMSGFPRQRNRTLATKNRTSEAQNPDIGDRNVDIAMSAEEKEEHEEHEEKGSGSCEPSRFAFRGTHLRVTEKQDQLLGEAFPWVERTAEYRKMDAWLEANAERRPKNHSRFAHNWFSKIDTPGNRRERSRLPGRRPAMAVEAAPGKYDNLKPHEIL